MKVFLLNHQFKLQTMHKKKAKHHVLSNHWNLIPVNQKFKFFSRSKKFSSEFSSNDNQVIEKSSRRESSFEIYYIPIFCKQLFKKRNDESLMKISFYL